MDKQEQLRAARRAALLRLASLGAGAAGLLAGARSSFAAGSMLATPGFRHIKGPVAIEGQRAMVGMVVRPGQTVQTATGAEALYLLGGDVFFQRDNAKVTFDDSSGTPTLRVAYGRLLATFAHGQRRLVTPTASIALRGTGCYVEADNTKTYFCLCYGEADVTANADPSKKETLRTQHHEHPLVIHARGASPLIAPATFTRHTDEELTLLENQAGRWPAFHPRAK